MSERGEEESASVCQKFLHSGGICVKVITTSRLQEQMTFAMMKFFPTSDGLLINSFLELINSFSELKTRSKDSISDR